MKFTYLSQNSVFKNKSSKINKKFAAALILGTFLFKKKFIIFYLYFKTLKNRELRSRNQPRNKFWRPFSHLTGDSPFVVSRTDAERRYPSTAASSSTARTSNVCRLPPRPHSLTRLLAGVCDSLPDFMPADHRPLGSHPFLPSFNFFFSFLFLY